MFLQDKQIKIIITDDHPIILNGIIHMLSDEPNIQFIGVCHNGDELLASLKTQLPDVILLDIQMPGQTGDELTKIIHKLYPEIKIIALSNFDNPLFINTLLSNGAVGYLLKTVQKNELINALTNIMKGEIVVSESLKDQLLLFKKSVHKPQKFALTKREKEILTLVVEGCKNTEIADKLHLSIRTIENYRFNLSLKLGAKNTASLIQKALELGIK